MSTFPSGLGDVERRVSRLRTTFNADAVKASFVERTSSAYDVFVAQEGKLPVAFDAHPVEILALPNSAAVAGAAEVEEGRDGGGGAVASAPRDSARLPGRNLQFVGSTVDSLKRMVPWLDFVDAGGGLGGDCSLMAVCDAFCDGSARDQEGTARALRLQVITAMRAYDEKSATFPMLESISDFASAQQWSAHIVEHLQVLLTEKREAGPKQKARRAARTYILATLNRRTSSRLRGATEAEEFPHIEADTVAELIERRFRDIYVPPPPCSVMEAIENRTKELEKSNEWFDHSEWMFICAILRRRVFILQGTKATLDGNTEHFVNVVRLPDCNTGRELEELPAVLVAFVADSMSASPCHYVRVMASAEAGCIDDSSEEDILLIQSPPAVVSLAPLLVSSPATPAATREDSPRLGLSQSARSTRRPPLRPPFSIDPSGYESHGSELDIEEFVLKISRQFHVAMFKYSRSKSRIVYRCQHTAMYQKKREPTCNPDSEWCDASLVFLVSTTDRGLFTLSDKSQLKHSCPGVIPSVKITLEIVVAKLLKLQFIPTRNVDVQRLFPAGTVDCSMASRSRREAIVRKYGTAEDNFAKIESLLSMFCEADPNFRFDIQVEFVSGGGRKFKRVYIEFAYARHVMANGIPFVSIDACHSRYALGGVYYIAVTMSPMFQVIPLALVYEGAEENNGGWKYLCEHLAALAPAVNAIDGVLMSDRRAGIGFVLNETFPLADKVACSRHVGNNAKALVHLHKQSVDVYVNQLAKASNRAEYEAIEARMLRDSSLSHSKVEALLAYLRAPAQWTEDWAVHTAGRDAACRFGIVTSNASECMNAAYREARAMPICAALTFIISTAHENYAKLNASFWKKVQSVYREANPDNFAQEFKHELAPGPLLEKVLAAEQANRENAPAVTRLFVTDTRITWKVERTAEDGASLFRTVQYDRGLFSCTCHFPHLYGVPCRHVLGVIATERDPGDKRRPRWRYTDATSPLLRLSAAQAVLSYDISDVLVVDNHGLHRSSLIPHDRVARQGPPAARNRQGIKRKKQGGVQRIQSLGETKKRRPYKCSECGAVGHTRRKCHSLRDGNGNADGDKEDADEAGDDTEDNDDVDSDDGGSEDSSDGAGTSAEGENYE